MKLGIVIPYRDRLEHLDIFIPIIKKHLNNHNIDYKIVFVEQANNNAFNKCKLMNIGAKYLYDEVDYFCFHDVDHIPDIDVDYNIYDNQVIHLCGKLIENRDNIIKNEEFFYGMNFSKYYNKYKYYDNINRKLLSGVTLILKEIWRKHQWNEIFQGWGYEDKEYWYRLKYYNYNIIINNSRYISLSHKSNNKKNKGFLIITKYIFNYLKIIYLFKLQINLNYIIENSKYNLVEKSKLNDYEIIKVDFKNIKYSTKIILSRYIYCLVKKLIIYFFLYVIYKTIVYFI